MEKKHPVWQYEKGTGTLPGQRRKCALELIRRAGAEWIELVGFESMATRGTLVTMSLSNSICFPASSGPAKDSPVMCPSGRAKLATSPVRAGSPRLAETIGIVRVARWAARAFSLADKDVNLETN